MVQCQHDERWRLKWRRMGLESQRDQSSKKKAREYARQEGWSIDRCAKCDLEVVALFVEHEE